MGICMSTNKEVEDQKKRSQAIDRALDEDSKRLRRECKILLLGSGESGKSTIVKQMKIIHLKGYSEDELYNYRATVFKNLIECAKAVINAMDQFDIEPSNPTNREHCNFLLSYTVESGPSAHIEPRVGQAVQSIWSDPCIERLMEHQTEFYLMDSAGYFFDEVQRICAPDYLPNEMDVLRARTKTTGIYETRFQMGALSIHMFDVGGQRSERKKWIHCFENVTSIIFCVALSEYDQVLLEESSQNRMMESLLLFDSVVNSRWFMRTSIILFLNKVDIFKVKLPRSPLGNYFPDYSGGNDVNKAAKYLLWRFNQVNRAHLNLYPHTLRMSGTAGFAAGETPIRVLTALAWKAGVMNPTTAKMGAMSVQQIMAFFMPTDNASAAAELQMQDKWNGSNQTMISPIHMRPGHHPRSTVDGTSVGLGPNEMTLWCPPTEND
ncbi:putative G protein alpha subunit [Seiridium cardinale]|uniref:G protein alpha subunit n=1 Tax=Seiridium cardinale TaxID=138064 RepID=A0ABR2XS15_9PEZI